MEITVAITGRPNVGKSTLFNRLTERQHAIVDDQPGVTRDRREGQVQIGDHVVTFIDTAGLEQGEEGSLTERMLAQTTKAIEEADFNLFVIDGRTGVTSEDRAFATWLRQYNTPCLLLVNKCETKQAEFGAYEGFELGFGSPLPVSSAHGLGLHGLYGALLDQISLMEAAVPRPEELESEQSNASDNQHPPMQIAIVGRPNVGKSTFMNALLKEDRVLTGPEAGITRDAIRVDFRFRGKDIKLIDTAGLRRRTRVSSKVEQLSTDDTIRSIQYAHVVVIMMDATAPFEQQDMFIFEHCIREGRGIVIALNKWELIDEKESYLHRLFRFLEQKLPQILGVSVVTMSALYNKNCAKVIDEALKTYQVWNRYISTAKLNTWLQAIEAMNPPPLASNKRPIRLKYITQAKKRPPGFMITTNQPDQLPESYKRFLLNRLREDFELPGIPLRLMLKKATNPYKQSA